LRQLLHPTHSLLWLHSSAAFQMLLLLLLLCTSDVSFGLLLHRLYTDCAVIHVHCCTFCTQAVLCVRYDSACVHAVLLAAGSSRCTAHLRVKPFVLQFLFDLLDVLFMTLCC
jgi:hypothetical protein